MPCRLRREPLRAGATFMRVNSLTSLLRKRCLLRPPSSPPQMKKTNPILSGSFSFRRLCAAMPCHLRREPLRAGTAFMRYSGVPKRYFCTFGEKEHTSKRVSIIAPDNAISKAQCATLLRYYANVVCYAPPHLHQTIIIRTRSYRVLFLFVARLIPIRGR